jgi:hypothetical protein
MYIQLYIVYIKKYKFRIVAVIPPVAAACAGLTFMK